MSELKGQKPLFSFGIVADVQYCDCSPEGTRYYNLSKEKLQEAVGVFRNDSVSFVINLGDLIDRGYESFGPMLDILGSSGLRVYHVRGNHDFSVDERMKKKLPLDTPGRKGYYSFSCGSFRFIVLDGNEVSTYAALSRKSRDLNANYLAGLRKSGAVNAMEWNGGISESQIGWLKTQLDEAAAAEQGVFILCHFPVWPDNVHNLLNYKDINTLLLNYHNIIAWFSGHNHAGSYGNFNQIHFITMKGMVETAAENSFAVVDVYSNKIWIKGSGREKSRILAY
ncbi:MAG: metallophosphoesterase [Bacteroidales bacterium]|nr:metallophosphoesterase [Bacteroidales bacterium]